MAGHDVVVTVLCTPRVASATVRSPWCHTVTVRGGGVAVAEQLVMSAMGREVTADEGRPWVIGRDKAADLHLENASVSRRHAVVRFDPTSGWLLEDANS